MLDADHHCTVCSRNPAFFTAAGGGVIHPHDACDRCGFNTAASSVLVGSPRETVLLEFQPAPPPSRKKKKSKAVYMVRN